MDLKRIVSELKKERDRLDRAIAALEETDAPSATKQKASAPTLVIRKTKKRGHLSPEGRKKLSEVMKKRWADRRRKGTNGHKAA